MRKIFVNMVLAVTACSAASQYYRNNIFLGAGLGVGHEYTYDDYAFAWSIFGGYEYRPIRIVGVMAYLESFMEIKPYELGTRITTQLSVNADVSLEILQLGKNARIGPYLGAGFGYATTSITTESQASNPAVLFLTNLGLQMVVDESSVVRLGVKMPFNIKESHTSALQIVASYAYKF